MKKPKFKPEITRVKLNPEQAVLTCVCYGYGYRYQAGDENVPGTDNSPACNGKTYTPSTFVWRPNAGTS